jgi:Ca2+-transporting ATPase
MDTFAALALATDPATKASLDRKPDRKNAPLITVEILKMILIQATYQIIVCLVLHFAGHAILHMPYSTETDAELRSLVFNCFVFCQICERWSGLDLWLLRLIWRGIVLMRA